MMTRHSLLMVLLLAIWASALAATSCGDSSPCPAAAKDGDACTLAPTEQCDYRAKTSTCSYTRCLCVDGKFECTSGNRYSSGESCKGDDHCGREGNASCEMGSPYSGGCDCSDGKWRCYSVCPDGCPSSYTTSIEGDGCSFTDADGACTYRQPVSITCHCKAGELVCK